MEDRQPLHLAARANKGNRQPLIVGLFKGVSKRAEHPFETVAKARTLRTSSVFPSSQPFREQRSESLE